MNDLIIRLKEFLKKGTTVKIVVFLGLAGMGLIFISSMIGGNNSSKNKSEGMAESISTETDNNAYSVLMENKLKGILETIDGVGKTQIMVTVSESEEYVYAQEEKTNSSYSDSATNQQEEKQYVIVENNGEKKPILKKTVSPQISGVVIVCEGGGNSIVCENIYKTVSVVLGIPSNKIYVAKLK